MDKFLLPSLNLSLRKKSVILQSHPQLILYNGVVFGSLPILLRDDDPLHLVADIILGETLFEFS